MMKNLNKFKKTIVVILILGVILPFFPLLKPRQANALAVPVMEVGANLAANSASAASNALTAGMTSSLVTKEYVLDTVLYALVKPLLHQFTNSIVDWIVNAYPGDNPLFPTNFTDYLMDVGDERIAAFMDDYFGSIRDLLCSPFRFEIEKPLLVFSTPKERDLSFNKRIECTLAGIVVDIDAFFDGDFSQGGWAGFLEMTQVSQNDPWGALGIVGGEMAEETVEVEGAFAMELESNKGMLGIRECVDGTAGVDCKKWEIQTPGSAIQDALGTGSFGETFRELEAADELSEMFIAVISSLLGSTFGPGAAAGISGLF